VHLQRQFNLVVIPLVIIPLLILGWLAYGYLLESERNKLTNKMTTDLNIIQQAINIKFSQAKANIELLASDDIVTRYAVIEDEFSRYKLFQTGLISRFKSYQTAFPLYQEIRFILPDGYEDSHWSEKAYTNLTDEEEDSSWFPLLKDLKQTTLNIILDNPDTGSKSLYSFNSLILRHTSSEDSSVPKRLRGYLATTIKLDWLEQDLKSLISLNNSSILLQSPNKEAIYSYGNLSFHDVTNTSTGKNIGINLIKTNEINIYELKLNTVFGYTLSYRIKESHAFIKANELAGKILIITIGSIIFSLITLILLLRFSVILPLNKLALASHDIGIGKLDSRVDLHSCDELADITDGFNSMVKSLSDNDEKIRYIAYHDSLTRLPNRRMFQYLLANSIAAADRNKDQLALFFLDIDNFKTINDSLGHDIGDELLIQFAQRVNQCLREEDTFVKPDSISETLLNDTNDLIARLGGDEFTIVLPHLSHASDAAIVSQRIIQAMAKDFTVGKHHFRITTSIGIALYPSNGDDIDELIRHADIAMYHAKDQGKNNFQFYAEDLNEAIADRVERENALRKAIEENQLSVYFQPQISLPSRNIYGLEALVRWHHPTKGMISPMMFIPLAEETGMILELGQWVMRESCRIAKEWFDLGLLDFRISVNVSSIQFERQDVPQLIVDSLNEFQLSAEYLTVELTESAIMSHQDENLLALDKIKRMGVKVSLDDFGTGYSSLSYLRSFPVDTLKIDRQFIIEAKTEPEVRAIISAIVQMAHALNLDVVGEGIEDIMQLQYLEKIGCDVIQGFYFSKPLPQEQALSFIKNNAQHALK